MKKYILIIGLIIIMVGCPKNQIKTEGVIETHSKMCEDGYGEYSFFNNDGSIALYLGEKNDTSSEIVYIENWAINTPKFIVNKRIAYILEDECKGMVKYYILENNNSIEVDEKTFYIFIDEVNITCEGCIEIYSSGCC